MPTSENAAPSDVPGFVSDFTRGNTPKNGQEWHRKAITAKYPTYPVLSVVFRTHLSRSEEHSMSDSKSNTDPDEDLYSAAEIAEAIRRNRRLPDKSNDPESVDAILKAIPRNR